MNSRKERGGKIQLMIRLWMSLVRMVGLGIFASSLLTYGKFWRQCCQGNLVWG